MSFFKGINFNFEASKGNIPNHSIVLIGGYNGDIDTGTQEDLWSPGGTLVPLTTARLIDFTSTNAGDDAAGAGARTMLVLGLDSNGDQIQDVVTFTAGAATTNLTFIWVQTLVILTAGSNEANLGDITGVAQVDATNQIGMPSGLSLSQNSQYKVPTGHTLYLFNIEFSAAKTSGGGTAVIEFRGQARNAAPNSPWVTFVSRKLDTAVIDQLIVEQPVQPAVQAGGFYKLVATTDSNNTEARARTYAILVKN